MKKFGYSILLALALLAFTPDLFGREKYSAWCQQGGQAVRTSGLDSTTFVQRSFKTCTVTVYLTGTTTLATIFSDNSGTALANPFTNSQAGDTGSGQFFFYADNSTYDVKIAATGLTTYTLAGVTLQDNLSAAGVVACAYQAILYVGQNGCFAGSDIGAQINTAYAALPAKGGRIGIFSQTGCYSFSTPIVFNTVSKPVILEGVAPSGNSNDSNQGGACLNYTPTTATTAITMDWTNTGGNGFFGAGSGMRDITLVNNGSCETQGGCGSSAIGLKIGGTNGGVEHAMFENVKIQGFGTGLYNPNTSSATVWGNVLVNATFKHNTLGADFANASEGWLFLGGLFIQGTRAVRTSAAVNITFVRTHFDNHSIWGSGGGSTTGVLELVGNAKVDLISPHFENLDQTTGANSHFIYSTSDVTWTGGEAIDNKTTGNTAHWFWFVNNANVSGVDIGTGGSTATNLFLNSGAGSFQWMVSGNPPNIAGCPTNPTTLTCQEINKTTNVVKSFFPTLQLGNSAGATILQPTAGAGSNTITFPTVSGVVHTSGNTIQYQKVGVGAAGGGCPTAASVGATCTSAAVTWPVTMGDTTYNVVCTISGTTNVPAIVNVTKSAATFTITIAALTAAAANFTSADCIGSHL